MIMTRREELTMAETMWKDWIMAERAVMTGQEYRIGTRNLRRADLSHIRSSIRYWKCEVDRLTGRSRTKVRQVIHRDL